MKKKEPKSKIHSQMKLGEIVMEYPQTVEVFFKYGLPCAGCHVASFETLEEGAMGHGIKGKKLEELVEELNEVALRQDFDDELSRIAQGKNEKNIL